MYFFTTYTKIAFSTRATSATDAIDITETQTSYSQNPCTPGLFDSDIKSAIRSTVFHTIDELYQKGLLGHRVWFVSSFLTVTSCTFLLIEERICSRWLKDWINVLTLEEEHWEKIYFHAHQCFGAMQSMMLLCEQTLNQEREETICRYGCKILSTLTEYYVFIYTVYVNLTSLHLFQEAAVSISSTLSD